MTHISTILLSLMRHLSIIAIGLAVHRAAAFAVAPNVLLRDVVSIPSPNTGQVRVAFSLRLDASTESLAQFTSGVAAVSGSTVNSKYCTTK